MIDTITRGIAKLFGTKSERDLKEILPAVKLINEEYAHPQSISDEQLRAKTTEVKSRIAEDLKAIDDELKSLHDTIRDQPNLDLNHKEEIFNKIDKLDLDRNKKLEEVLLKVLPLSFAIVKETARRFKDNGQLVVQATPHDIKLAQKRTGIELIDDKAIWKNKWKAAGNEITWGHASL